ncbi:MAG: N-acetylmuramoyl-L-alanine amidase [Oscillospiraceae bacterium]|nr:N-acetylmuramoyl-L-alanine amidase [Oscillospiraceae bacterium]
MRKKWGSLWTAILLAVLFLLGAVLVILHLDSAKTVLAEQNSLPLVIIDPGHGGMDGGAIGTDGQVEKEINLSIALKLRDMLESNGITTLMTRESDVSIHDQGCETVREQKTSDLKNRLKLMNEASDAVFVSIHQNKYTSSSAKGAQVFYSTNREESKLLAEILQKNLTEMLQPENTRVIKPGTKALFLLYKAEKPAVLIECGFLSNYEEAKRLSGTEYQEQLAFSIFCSLLQYLDNSQSPADM